MENDKKVEDSSGHMASEKVRNKKEYPIDNIMNKIVLYFFPVVSFLIAIFSILDKNTGGFIIFTLLFIVGINSLIKKRVDNKTWFIAGRWILWLSWLAFLLFLFSIIFSVYNLLIK